MAHILIVDDEPLQRLLIQETLADDPSLTFTEAENGLQALEKARSVQPDVIILDGMMPVMDGLAVCNALRSDQNIQPIPGIFATAFPETFDEVTRLSSGVMELVKKPFEEMTLKAAVWNIIRERRGA